MGRLGQERSSQTNKPFIWADICGWNSWQDSLCCLWAAFVAQLLPQPIQAWHRHWPTPLSHTPTLPNTPKISNLPNTPLPHSLYGLIKLSWDLPLFSWLCHPRAALAPSSPGACTRKNFPPFHWVLHLFCTVSVDGISSLPSNDMGGRALASFEGIFWCFPHRRRSCLMHQACQAMAAPQARRCQPGTARQGLLPGWAGRISCTHPSCLWGVAEHRLWGSQLGVTHVEPRWFSPMIQARAHGSVVLYTDQAVKSRVYPIFCGYSMILCSLPLFAHILLPRFLWFLPQGLGSS